MTTATISSSSSSSSTHEHNLDYETTLQTIRDCARAIGGAAKHAFVTDATGLWEAYLSALPAAERQHHTCTSCRKFIERFGAIVVVGEDGLVSSLLWARGGHGIYDAPIRAMSKLVTKAKINDAVVTTDRDWGQAVTGPWHHFAIEADGLCAALVATPSRIETADQQAAKIRHEHGLLCIGVVDYSQDLVQRAVALLQTDKLYRSEVCIGVAKWLLQIHQALAATSNTRIRDNLLWQYAASAPPGWCHVRSGMIGTLLDDLKEDLPFETVAAKFRAKMDPTQYMRPTAQVSTGNVAQAEKIIEALGLRESLQRRFAKIEDLTDTLWSPPAAMLKPKTGGVFGHLVAPIQETRDLGTPPVQMTWAKFARDVLGTAERIEFNAPAHGNYVALVTAANGDAPPILQWDRPDRRNPLSWYVYRGGTPVGRWGIRHGWNDVRVICTPPSRWHGAGRNKEDGRLFLILAGAKDTQYAGGAAFFPECLRSELHEIRNTMEAYATRSVIAGRDEATACGYDCDGARWDIQLRVTSQKIRTTYIIDRWE